MYKKFTQLSFVIGLFFSIVAVILLANAFLSPSASHLDLNTGMVFLAFGLLMMFVKSK